MTSRRLAYSPSEAANLIGISVRSVRYLIATGKLGCSRIGRRVVEDDQRVKSRQIRKASLVNLGLWCLARGEWHMVQPLIRLVQQEGLAHE